MAKRLLFVSCLALVATSSAPVHASRYDLNLSRLGTVKDGKVALDLSGFRSLSSELGTVIAPRPVDPADSLGISGFALSADLGLTTISNNASFWSSVTQGTTSSSVVPTLQIMARKGLWPGLEIGGGATKLFDSRMWGLNGYTKIAIHEGFHHLPIPAIAVRGMFSGLLGARDHRMGTIGADASISHVFGIGNTFSLTPYVGYQMLFVMARTGILDATPAIDEYPDGTNDPGACGGSGQPECIVNEFIYNRQMISRHRPFVGMRVIYSVFRLGVEAMFVPPGKSQETLQGGTAIDQSAFQQQYSISLGLDF
jgi:hypothetical protein